MLHAVPRDSRKVLFFLDQLSVGGVERVVLNLIEGLVGTTWQPVLALRRAAGELLAAIPPGVPVKVLRHASFPLSVFALAELISVERPAIVTSQRHNLNLAAVLARELSGQRPALVLAEHELLSLKLRDRRIDKRPADWLLPHVMPGIYQVADAVVGVSQGVVDEFRERFKVPADKLHLLYNPLIPEGPRSLPDDVATPPWPRDGLPTLVAVGRLAPIKGFAYLLEAFRRLLSRRPVRLAFVGAGPERQHLENRARQLKIADHVHFLGIQANPCAWMRCADVLVLSSLIESFPTVLVEAMAAGTPVVAFDCPHGPREIITHGRDGLLVPPEDAPGLARAIARVLDEPELAASLRAGGLRRALDFTYARTVSAYCDVFAAIT